MIHNPIYTYTNKILINYNNEWEMYVIFPSIHVTNVSISENESFYERRNSVFCFSTIFLCY